MSKFTFERSDMKMSARLEYVLQPGMTLIYEYDFGTTTHLLAKVLSKFESEIEPEKIEILARNDPPEIKCSYCEKEAEFICKDCKYSNKGWLCRDCVKDHKCPMGKLLPVVNSPRTGECGYTGN